MGSRNSEYLKITTCILFSLIVMNIRSSFHSVNRRDASNFISRLGRIENVLNECIQRLVKERLSIKIDAICALIASCNNQRSMHLMATIMY